MLLPVLHQIPGGGGGEAGHPLEQGGRRGIRIHSNSIDAVLYHAVQRLSQAGLGHIVLILSHADGLGVDLHQLGQGILEPPGDGHGASQVHIVLWKLLGGQLAGGVHRRPRLADDHIAQPAPQAADELHGRLLRLPAGRSVADGDVLHPVLPHQLGQPGNGLLPLPRTVGGVDHRGVQHLSGAVHHRHLTAHAVAGVQSHGHPALHRGLHQQGLQIQGEGADGPLVGLLGELCPDLPLQRGLKQPLPGVVRRPPDKFHGGGPRDGPAPDRHPGSLRIQLHRYLQQLLPLPPVDGQRLIALDPAHRALEIVVQTVDAVLRLLVRRFGGQYAPAEVQLAQLLPQVGPVGDLLS